MHNKIFFLEGNNLLFSFDQWASVWSCARGVLEDAEDGSILLFSENWFTRQTLSSAESSLFAEFLKEMQEKGITCVGLLSAPLNLSFLPWVNFFSSTGLIKFIEPLDFLDFGSVGIVSSFASKESKGEDEKGTNLCSAQNLEKLNDNGLEKYVKTLFFVNSNLFSGKEIENIIAKYENKSLFWVFYGIDGILKEGKNWLGVGNDLEKIRILTIDITEGDLQYAYSSFNLDFTIPVLKEVFFPDRCWIEEKEASLLTELVEKKCAPFRKMGFDTASMANIRSHIFSGDDPDNFFELLDTTLNN